MNLPICAQASPYELDVEEGQIYSWCTCGLSKKQPLCDGAHKQTDSGMKSLKFAADASKTVYLCGCKQTKTPPFCDGSHEEIDVSKEGV